VIGPDSRNFADMVELLRNAGAILQVTDADDLLLALEGLLSDADAGCAQVAKARQTIRTHSGATARTLYLLEPLLPDPREAAAGHRNPDRRHVN